MKKCIVCGNKKSKFLYRNIGLLKCSNCSHIFYSDNLCIKKLNKLYGKNYFYGDEFRNYLADKKVWQKNFKLRWQALRKFLDFKKHQRLLKIGCAYGLFLDLVKDNFNEILGIDISSPAVKYVKQKLGFKAIRSNFVPRNFSKKRFDVVCFWDTIEHLKRPDLYLRKVRKSMNKGALLAITTGDIGSLVARIRGKKWRLIHPPTHLHYFSKKTITKLLNKNGFRVIYCRSCGYYRSLHHMIYIILSIRSNKKHWYNYIKNSKLIKGNFYLNLHDIIYVIAKKI
ncbi:hypothetical protein COT75_02950 [Candidatus Beckwithbacteria bacterium CG10_big_fil_rev_8_21_14_0_10_34_10]|uniref:Class I SAM-dependent methyltransferase n=1 Tax=Candidatus Beckwithbacteria bacterium CG10_big_fil_rev_8_21_14_0_10_34_10 TaxID=1974495 RepID=A0A2H0W960_9BACT|nr:MAG: hypothetical protein COT75_02950 [Candidatus Beckwithbacteria bacterium CG10_big_fil_rev_8_21_14_0_10_34_10]